jgi:ribosomal protein L37AE/L43A
MASHCPSAKHLNAVKPSCSACGESFSIARHSIGYTLCMPCGELQARGVNHTIVPMPKSNYIVVTDRSLLLNLNSSHKGGR